VAAANDKSVAAWEAVEQVLEARVMPVLDKVGLAAPAQYGVDLLGKGVHRVSAQVVELTRAAPARRQASGAQAGRKEGRRQAPCASRRSGRQAGRLSTQRIRWRGILPATGIP
jgi:hypothetical protein